MIALALGQIARLTGGITEDPEIEVSGPVVVDSRRAAPGSLFAAFAGERVDGHEFAKSAVAQGAVAALVSRPVDVPHVLVDDVLVALSDLAHHVSRVLQADSGLTVIGITGSQGKTSTKDLLSQVLSAAGPTVAARDSFNNELGVPLTVLSAQASTRFLVVEMGARGIGHVAGLCDIAAPSIGVVLNVGDAHLQEFGSREQTARAKGELIAALPAAGTAILNADDPLVSAMTGQAATVTFGARGDVRPVDVVLKDDGSTSFQLQVEGRRHHVDLPLIGAHQVANAAAAAAAAFACGMPAEDIAAALSSARVLSPMRMESLTREDGLVIVNDAYNANPESMAAALASLAAIRCRGRRFAVVGEMLELGALSADRHRGIGRRARELGIDVLVTVGTGARPAADGFGDGAIAVKSPDEAVARLAADLGPGDVVLVKASRSVGLERVVSGLMSSARHT